MNKGAIYKNKSNPAMNPPTADKYDDKSNPLINKGAIYKDKKQPIYFKGVLNVLCIINTIVKYEKNNRIYDNLHNLRDVAARR